MKIVFCGPPHSGKSVFVANLLYQLPSDAYTIIRACPDGEGTWSNNKKQNETNIVRKKGKFTKAFIDDACQAIDNQTNKIVLVDVGGVMSKENEQVFKHCDSFVVLSSDEKQKQEWLEFGQKLGLECVGCLDSSLEGKEEIYSKEPFLTGRIVGLERGEELRESEIIKELVSKIVKKSKYSEKSKEKEQFEGIMIDDTEFGFELGYGKEILTDDGISIKKVQWQEKAVSEIYKAIKQKVNAKQPIRINGVRANFTLSAICKAAKQNGATDIKSYDVRSKQYIYIRNMPKKKNLKSSEGIAYNILKNKENIFMDIDITKDKYTLEDYKKCVLPKIKEGKNLYLSGRLPLWLLASISNSYDMNKIFTFQPGKGFTCIAATDERELGKIVDGVNGININQYFEDKKEKSKLPAIVEKNGVRSKLKKIIAKIKGRKENLKYVDNSIVIEEVRTVKEAELRKDTFKAELKIKNSKENNIVIPKNNVKQQEQDKVPSDIGG